MQRKILGIVREGYSKWERRAPLTPSQVAVAIQTHGLDVVVQPSTQRIFTDNEYLHAGARIRESLSDCDCIVGVKQVSASDLLPNKTYLFFSHTIKAQEGNMPLLDRILESKVRLVDHECIKDAATGQRLVAFGGHAGKAGMLESIRGLGLRLLGLGYSTPLLNLGPVYSYKSYELALAAAQQAVQDYAAGGGSEVFLPAQMGPLRVVFTGAGKVSSGAQEVFQSLPHTEMLSTIEDLALASNPNKVYGLCVRDRDVIRHNDSGWFNKPDYRKHASEYNADLFAERVLPHANVVVTGAYWDDRYPRWLANTPKVLANAKKLLLVADLSCDVNGSFQGLSRSTTIDDPFLWVDFGNGMREVRPATSAAERNPNVKLVLGVDILPSELPREASQHFGDCLLPFLRDLCEPEFASTALQRAVIAEKGALTESFSYIGKIRHERQRESKYAVEQARSATLELRGHLFDTRLVNRVLDLIENRGGGFQIAQASLAHPRQGFDRAHTLVQLKVSSPTTDQLEELLVSIERLVSEAPDEADAVVTRQQQQPQQSAEPKPRVVVLGSGLVSAPAIDYLIGECGVHVLVVSESQSELEALHARFPASLSTVRAKVHGHGLGDLLAGSRCVLSLLPPPMHLEVAKACLKAKVPLVTASYAGALTELHAEAKQLGVPLLCEMGLDPGMDHMSVMRIVNEFGAKEIVGFESYCGGLVSPECANNPLGYKLTWSPRGVLTALKNPARFVRDFKVRDEPNILAGGGGPFEFNSLASLNLEYLPNRDSLQYAEPYGLQLEGMETFFRGTLRYKGFTEVLRDFQRQGWLEDVDVLQEERTWGDVCRQQDFTQRSWSYLEPNLNRKLPTSGSKLDALCALFQDTLRMQPGDRDLILMEHRFKLRSGALVRSTLSLFGNQTDSAMSTTVGTTAAVGVQLVLEGGHKGAGGVHLPTADWVYNPALAHLHRRGIRFEETS